MCSYGSESWTSSATVTPSFGDGRRAPALVEHRVAPAGAQRAGHGLGELVHSAADRLARIRFEHHLFGSHRVLLFGNRAGFGLAPFGRVSFRDPRRRRACGGRGAGTGRAGVRRDAPGEQEGCRTLTAARGAPRPGPPKASRNPAASRSTARVSWTRPGVQALSVQGLGEARPLAPGGDPMRPPGPGWPRTPVPRNPAIPSADGRLVGGGGGILPNWQRSLGASRRPANVTAPRCGTGAGIEAVDVRIPRRGRAGRSSGVQVGTRSGAGGRPRADPRRGRWRGPPSPGTTRNEVGPRSGTTSRIARASPDDS